MIKFKEENICRWCFESIFKKRFIKKRPAWLNNFELDGYCEELKIAFEYQGPHHFEEYIFYKSDKDKSLKEIQDRDKFKIESCKKNGIKLFIINSKKNIKIKDITLQIEEQINKFNIHSDLFEIIPDLHYSKKAFNFKNNKTLVQSKYNHDNYIFNYPEGVAIEFLDDLNAGLRLNKEKKKGRKKKTHTKYEITKYICI